MLLVVKGVAQKHGENRPSLGLVDFGSKGGNND